MVGWYSSGPKIRENDLAINELFRKYYPQPVLVICDVNPKDLGLPVEAYVAVEEVSADGTETAMTFRNVPSEMGAQEAEEVGVEHLLRDIKDTRVSTIAGEVVGKVHSLQGTLRGVREHFSQEEVNWEADRGHVHASRIANAHWGDPALPVGGGRWAITRQSAGDQRPAGHVQPHAQPPRMPRAKRFSVWGEGLCGETKQA